MVVIMLHQPFSVAPLLVDSLCSSRLRHPAARVRRAGIAKPLRGERARDGKSRRVEGGPIRVRGCFHPAVEHSEGLDHEKEDRDRDCDPPPGRNTCEQLVLPEPKMTVHD